MEPTTALTRQCTGTAKHTGERCKRAPIPGGSVCAMHGGNTPMVRQAAQRRLIGMVEPALDGLEMAMRQDPCDKCGRPADMSLVVRAAQIVLDRSGLGPQGSLLVEHRATPHPFAKWMTQEQLEQIAMWCEEAEQRRRRGEPASDEYIVEAEVIASDDAVLVDE